MKRIIKAVTVSSFLTISILFSMPAIAQGSNFYVGGAFGQSKMKEACDGLTIACDGTDAGWKIFGGYQINNTFAAEIGYLDMGKAVASGTITGAGVYAEGAAKAWEFLGVGTLPLANRLSAYGKLGFFRWDLTTSASAVVPGFAAAAASTSDTGTDFTYGIGFKFEFTKSVEARAEWQRYNDVGTDSTGKGDVDLLSLGIVFKF